MKDTFLRNALRLILDRVREHEVLSSFFFASLLIFVLQQFKGVTNFPWDARGYWHLSDPSIFFNYPNEIRGYFYPLLLLPAHAVTNLAGIYHNYPYRIYSSIIYGALLACLLPAFYQHAFGGKVTFLRRMVVPVLVAILCPGPIIYPLSDLPAFLLLVASLLALLKLREKNAPQSWMLVLLGVSGFLAGGAYNTRTIYLFPALIMLAMIPFYLFHDKSRTTKLIAVSAFVAGTLLVSIPQSIINHYRHGTFSPMVIYQNTDKSLFALQMMWGITNQRYETSIDPLSPSPSLFYMDKAGERLFADEKLETANVSIREYLSLVAKRPIDFIGIFGRHVVNGLDLTDGDVYVKSNKASRNKIKVINFSVIFLGFLSIAALRSREWTYGMKQPSSSWPLFLLVLVTPVIAIIPGAIETRFFLPLQLLLYCTIAFNSSRDTLVYAKSNWKHVAGALIVVGTLFFSISTTTMSSMQTSINPIYRFQP